MSPLLSFLESRCLVFVLAFAALLKGGKAALGLGRRPVGQRPLWQWVLLGILGLSGGLIVQAQQGGSGSTTPPGTLVQADMQIRIEGESGYTGAGIYNAHGSQQVKMQRLTGGAIYYLKLRNDGAVTSSFAVTGSSGRSAWTVKYFDAPSGGNEITGAVTGSGWVTGDLAPGAFREFRLEVIPGTGGDGKGGNVLNTMVKAKSSTAGQGSAGVDLVKAVTRHSSVKSDTNAPPVANPDAYSLAEDTSVSIAPNELMANDLNVDLKTATELIVTGPASGVLEQNLDGSYLYTPNPNFNGTDSFTYLVSDGGVSSNITTVVLTVTAVNDAPVAQPLSLIADSGVTTPLTLTATDVDGDVLTYRVVTAPSHGTLGGTAPNLTYTSAANYVGPDSLRFVASDGRLESAPAPVDITVRAIVQADNWIRKASETAYSGDGIYNDDGTGQSRDQKVSAGVTAVYHLKIENDALVPGVFTIVGPRSQDGWTVRYFDALIGGNEITDSVTQGGLLGLRTLRSLEAGQALDWRLEVTPEARVAPGASLEALVRASTISNPTGVEVGVDAVKAVTRVNRAPVAVDDDYSTEEDTTLSVGQGGLLANDNDPDGDVMTAVLVARPQHGTLTLNPNGTFVYVPVANYHGPDSFSYKASDGSSESAVASVTLTVLPRNDAPVATDDNFSTREDTPLRQSVPGVLANDFDPDGDALTASLVSGPSQGTLALAADGSFVYSPKADFNGADSFTYKVSDGDVSSAPATVTITVTPVNDAPTAAAQSVTTEEDTALPITLSGDDIDGDALTFAVVSAPQHGTLSVLDGAGITYTPNANYNGPDAFSFKANDGQADSAPATVSITVTPANDAPVAHPGAATTNEDESVALTLSASDADGDALVYALSSLPAHGTLSVNGTVIRTAPHALAGPTLRYTPNANYSGADSFTFQANDGTADSNAATFDLSVQPVNDAPSASPQSVSTPEDTPQSITLTGDDPEGQPLSFSIVTAPQHGTLSTLDGATVTYTPARDYQGPDAFSFKASDGTLESAPATISITVTPVNDAPVAQDGTARTDEDAAVSFMLQASDADGDPLTYTVLELPQHGTLAVEGTRITVAPHVLSGPNLTYTPNAGYSGSDALAFKANDGQADSNRATVSITVSPINHAPIAVDDSAQTRAGTPVVIAVLANDSSPDGRELRVDSTTTPSHGSAVANPDGTITYTPEANFDGSDSFTYTLSDGAGLFDTATVRVTVQALPTLSVEDVSLNEGAADTTSQAVVTVRLSAPASHAVTVAYATFQGTATAGEDYTSTQGSLTFEAGATEKTVAVNVIGDALIEPDESFEVRLSQSVGAAIADPSGVVTILNDDVQPVEGACGPIDVAFVIDDTGSMGEALDAINNELANILGDIEETSGGNYRLSLVTFKDDVNVRENFAPNNRASIEAKIRGLYADGGNNGPEASDEALNTVVNALPAAGRPQNQDFSGFRSGVLKIAIVVTDALPAGFDDDFTSGDDDRRARRVAMQAASKGIKIAAVHVNPNYDGAYEEYYGVAVSTILREYARITGAPYIQAQGGSGAEAAVREIIRTCGGFAVPEAGCLNGETDTQAPAVSITRPAQQQGGETLDSLTSIDGTAEDAGCSGLEGVRVAIRRESDGLWWHGGGWGGSRRDLLAALSQTGTPRTWAYNNGALSGGNLPSGDYTIIARASDWNDNSAEVERRVTVRQSRPGLDASIRRADETAYTGEGIINTSGDGQERQATASSGAPAVYIARIKNTGDASGQFAIYGEGASSSGEDYEDYGSAQEWEVRYFDAAGQDITEEISYYGYGAGLEAGQETTVKVQVTPLSFRAEPLTLRLYTSVTDAFGTQEDVVRSVTTRASCGDTQNPTISITAPPENATLAGLTNVSGTAQDSGCSGMESVTVAVRRDADGAYWNGYGWGGYPSAQRASLGADGHWSYNPNLTGPRLANGGYEITATAYDGDGNSAAATRRFTASQPRPRIDFSIRKAQESAADFIGMGIYNTDGSGQTKTHTLDGAGSVTYIARLSNTGDAPTTAYLSANYPEEDWNVRYLAPDGEDISWQLYDYGYELELPAGAAREFKMEVSTAEGIGSGSRFDASLYAYQYDDWGYQQDVARGITTYRMPDPVPPPPECAVPVYFNDFEADALGGAQNGASASWTHTQRSTTPSGRRFLGEFSNDAVELTLSNLPQHHMAQASFDLFMLKSWDGNNDPNRWKLTEAGADGVFDSADDRILVQSNFSNVYYLDQSYPDAHGAGSHPPRTGAYESNSLGYGFYGDSVYRIGFALDHGAPTLKLRLQGLGLEDVGNESWGVDNFKVHVLPDGCEGSVTPVPTPLPTATPTPDVTPQPTTEPTPEATATPLPQPRLDFSIRKAEESDAGFIGTGIYNTDGSGQTKTHTLTGAGSVTYVTRIANTGSAPTTATLYVYGDYPYDGWNVRYLNEDGEDITDQLYEGYYLELAAGASREIKMEVTAAQGTSPASRFDASLYAYAYDSVRDEYQEDVVRGITTFSAGTPTPTPTPSATPTPLPRPRLDFSIRKAQESADGFIGMGITNTDGSGQTKTHTLTGAGSVTYIARLSNTGSAPMTAYLSHWGDYPYDGWNIRYLAPDGTDVSFEVYDGYYTVEVAAGASHEIKMEVSAAEGTSPDSRFDAALYAYQYDDVDYQEDVVRGVTTFNSGTPTPTPTPGVTPTPSVPQTLDAVISGPEGYLGAGVFNTDATDQTSEQRVEGGTPANYAVALVNDAAVPRSVTVTAPNFVADEEWEVSIWTARIEDGGLVPDQDVTEAVTGEGYSLVLEPSNGGAPPQLLVRVVPAATLAPETAHDLLLLLSDIDQVTENGAEADAVKALTVKTGEAATPTPTETPTATPTAEPTGTPEPTATPDPNVTPAPTPTPAGPRVPFPDIKPEDHEPYGAVVTVTIELEGEAPPGTVIFYTRDGSQPTTRSLRYNGPFYVVSDTVVTSRAFAPECSPSQMDREHYVLGGAESDSAGNVNIVSPEDGSELTQPTPVVGTVTTPGGVSLVGWQLGYRLLDGPSDYQPLASGTSAKNNEELARFDPTLLLNGVYRLKLVGTYSNGTAQTDFHDIVVKGGMKIGHFSMSFGDITLPVAGLPLSITRTYDSRDTRQGDFGIGWSLSTADVRLQKNGPVGGSESAPVWQGNTGFGGGVITGASVLKPRVVSVTLPDGTVYSYRAEIQVAGNQPSTAPAEGTLVWKAQPGTRGSLKPVGSSRVYFRGGATRVAGSIEESEDENGDFYGLGETYDPKEWELTLPSGVVLRLVEVGNMAAGGKARLEWIRDLNGNKVVFTQNGMESQRPDGTALRTVSYQRDARGFITSIEDARGKRVRYVQDESGNLVTFTDRVGRSTHFDYHNPVYAHYVTSIRDPRGVTVARHFYGDDGRWLYTLMPNPKNPAQPLKLELKHDLNARKETVHDRMGNTSIMTYDSYGNVTRNERLLEEDDGGLRQVVSESKYEDDRNPEKSTQEITWLNFGTPSAKALTTIYEYDADGNRTKVVDPSGHATLMTYDRARVLKTTDVLEGRTRVLSENFYDAQGRLVWSKDALGRQTHYESYPNGAPKSKTNAKNETVNFALDSSTGNITAVRNAQNHLTTFSYDANGNRTGRTTTRTVRAPDGSTSAQTLVSATKFDAEDRPYETTSPLGTALGGTTYTHYNLIGRVDYSYAAYGTDAALLTQFEYDALGRRTTTILPDGKRLTTSYNDNDQVELSRDLAGRSVKTHYDTLGRQVGTTYFGADGTAITDAAGNALSTRTVYDDAGRVTSQRDERGATTRMAYDEAGRQTDVWDALENRTQSKYDVAGRAEWTKDAKGRQTDFAYDDENRVTLTTLPAIAPSTARSTLESKYDELGRVEQQWDASRLWKKFEFDNLGRLQNVTVPVDLNDRAQDLTTSAVYDEIGQKIVQQDAKGRITRFGYDAGGRLVWRRLPGGQTERMTYDLLGRLQTKTDMNGDTTTYRYDVRGRLTAQIPDASREEAPLTFVYPDERTKVATRGNIETTFVYDASRGWIDSVTTTGVGGASKIEYDYDAAGNRTRVKTTKAAQNGATTTRETFYDFDALGRLWKVRRGGATLAEVKYDAVGNREWVKRANNTTTFYEFDEQNRLTAMVHRPSDNPSQLLSGYAYKLHANGLRWQVSEEVAYPAASVPGSNAIAGATRTLSYAYDAQMRLTGERREETRQLRTGGSENETLLTVYDYDGAGNRLSSESKAYDGIGTAATLRQRVVEDHDYDTSGNDRLTKTTERSYNRDGLLTGTEVVNFGYNARGEQTSATYAPGTSNARTVRYGYDFEGRLTTWGEVDSPTGYSSNLFDAHGNRVAQTNGAGTSLAKQTRFVVDENLPNAQVLEEWELDGTGTGAEEKLEASYVYGDPDELVRLARRNSTTGSYDISYSLSDGLDSARQLTGEAGGVSDAYAYDAYGKGAAQVGATKNPYRFNSQRLEGNGNYFLRARQYNPAQGRFTSEDPMLGYASNPITQHRYQYGGLNPMMMVDPSGEEFSLCGMMSSIGANTAFTVRAVGVGMNVYDAAQSIDAWTQMYWDYAATGEIDNEALAMNIADIVLPHIAMKGFKRIFKRWMCFPAGTPVLMADGNKKPIEKIKAGDLVMSRDEKSGETKAKKVVKHWERQAQATLVLHFQSGEKIEATAEHPFFVEGEGFRPAAQLGIGTSIVTRAGPSAEIVKITRSEKPVKVYNFEVEDFHTYFVGQQSVWVHNSCQDYLDKLPTSGIRGSSPGTPRYDYQARVIGNREHQIRGGGVEIWADGVRVSPNGRLGTALDAKHIGNPAGSPYIPGSTAPNFIRDNVVNDLRDELRRYKAIIDDGNTPISDLEIITNNDQAADFFRSEMAQIGVTGRVFVRQ